MPNRPCWVEIDTQALEDNYRFLARLAAGSDPAVGAELLAIVKADAYGHSLALSAPAVVRGGARWLGVTSVEEGVAARAVAPGAEILVISGAFPGQGPAVVRNRLTPVVWDGWQMEEIEAAVPAGAPAYPVHLEIDTGMSRQGVAPGRIGALLARFRPGGRLRLDGLMTHLFAADESDGRITQTQLAAVERVLETVSEAGLTPTWLNVGNSAALTSGRAPGIAELAARHGLRAMLRPGLALYGLAPRFEPPYPEAAEPAPLAEARRALRPVLRWKTQVATVREIPAGAQVGYNGTFVATEPMRLALVAVGYADGLSRRLGNRFHALVAGQVAPLVGRISMDQAVVDITEIEGVQPGDEVVLLGRQGAEQITADQMAQAAESISWEIFTSIGTRVERRAV